jgi:hypothetical protein
MKGAREVRNNEAVRGLGPSARGGSHGGLCPHSGKNPPIPAEPAPFIALVLEAA